MSQNIYNNLITQLDKIYRHSRQGSYQTRRRYYEAMQRFCRFLAETYHLEKLANVSAKHMRAYADYMKGKELSASTQKTDLAAIRFFCDQMPSPHHKLPSNSDLGIERRSFGGTDRTWSETEFSGMVQIAEQLGRKDYVAIFNLARFAGLRIHECFRIDSATARLAIRNQAIEIKGKGGKVRTVQLTQPVVDKLADMLAITPPGNKLFVPDNMPTHIAIKRLQQFIIAHREKVMDKDAEHPISLHGLRHNYSVAQYQQHLKEICHERKAKVATSKQLGHNRPDVVGVYLASLKKRGGRDV